MLPFKHHEILKYRIGGYAQAIMCVYMDRQRLRVLHSSEKRPSCDSRLVDSQRRQGIPRGGGGHL